MSDWESIKTELFIKKIKNLITLTDYKNIEMNMILDSFINNEEMTSENNSISNSITQSEILSADISYLFKKPWNKLPLVHKIIKLKEFSKKISNTNSTQIKIEKELINLLKTKKLKSGDINYDSNNGRIIGIKNLNDKIN